MIRGRMRLPGFCMNGCFRVHSPPRQYKQTYNSIKPDDKFAEFSVNSIDNMSFNTGDTSSKGDTESGNRVMVVVDSTIEAMDALQWALSHTVQIQDTIILLHLIKPSRLGPNSNRQKAYELLCSMKSMSQMTRPGVHIEIALLEGKESGPTIVQEAKQRRVSLLVLGQRKPSVVWRLRSTWAGRRSRSRVVDYCIQHAGCLTIAVRRKSKRYGGYLITTKRHKNFWLLA
ncbi:uncharacterized protein LOC132286417 [Cornus florida]|uniref:uncharacterized protein LOC132286417 n=1 Tax=Cornus florida TaxID=4283 RepID=UPI00289EE354|nr:uncharacterized protein LOC132286417 [Cornus florida]